MGNIPPLLESPLLSLQFQFENVQTASYDPLTISVTLTVQYIFLPLEEIITPQNPPVRLALFAQGTDDSDSTYFSKELPADAPGYYQLTIDLVGISLLDLYTSKLQLYLMLKDGQQYFTSSYFIYQILYQFDTPQPVGGVRKELGVSRSLGNSTTFGTLDGLPEKLRSLLLSR